MPLMVIRESALRNNVDVMAAWCAERGALHAPHAKTTMSPQVVARHERAAGKYAEILALDHYLEVLKYKPGALPGAGWSSRACWT